MNNTREAIGVPNGNAIDIQSIVPAGFHQVVLEVCRPWQLLLYKVYSTDYRYNKNMFE